MNKAKLAQKIMEKVKGSEKDFWLHMLQLNTDLNSEEIDIFLKIYPRSKATTIERYWRAFCPKESKRKEKFKEIKELQDEIDPPSVPSPNLKSANEAEHNRILHEERKRKALSLNLPTLF